LKPSADGAGTTGDALVPRTLSQNGYETYGLMHPWLFTRVPTYDFYYPSNFQASDFQMDEKLLIRHLATGTFTLKLANIGNSGYDAKDFVTEKRLALSKKEGGPRFVYAHSLLPGHSEGTGSCRENEADLFKERVYRANQEMRDDLQAILSNNRESIIVVNGDHGPWINGDCMGMLGQSEAELTRLDLQDRFGAFLAIRWPTESRGEDRNIQTIQDTFAAVFSYLFEINKPMRTEPSRSTLGFSKFPAGLIDDGIIMVGPHAGEPLYKGHP